MIEKDDATADSLASGIFVLCPQKKWIEVLRNMGSEGFMIDGNGKISTTSSMKDTVEFKRNN